MLNIAIRDSNALYSYGLKALIHEYLKSNNIASCFNEKDNLISSTVNIVFLSVEDEESCILKHPIFSKGFSGVIFPVCNSIKSKSKMQIGKSCIQLLPVIYRHQSKHEIINLFRQQIEKIPGMTHHSTPKICQVCGQHGLNRSEMEVFMLLCREYRLTQIAAILGKNIKTVHTQKVSAMKKLNIDNNLDLYTFLRGYREMLVQI